MLLHVHTIFVADARFRLQRKARQDFEMKFFS